MVLLIVLPLAIMTRREPPPQRRRFAFAAWVFAGFLGAFATISFAIGLLILPLALVAIVGAAALATRAEVLGLMPGIGAMCLLVVALDIGEGPTAYSWRFGARRRRRRRLQPRAAALQRQPALK